MISINHVQYHWNHTTDGAFLEIWSAHISSIFFSYKEIDIFLNGLSDAIAKKVPTSDSCESETSIQINPKHRVIVNCDYSEAEYHVNLNFSFGTGCVTTPMLLSELITLKEFLKESL